MVAVMFFQRVGINIYIACIVRRHRSVTLITRLENVRKQRRLQFNSNVNIFRNVYNTSDPKNPERKVHRVHCINTEIQRVIRKFENKKFFFPCVRSERIQPIRVPMSVFDEIICEDSEKPREFSRIPNDSAVLRGRVYL